MAGEVWRGAFQAAVEVTYGTSVLTATRRLYYNSPDSVLSRQQPGRIHRFLTGTRDNVRSITQGPVAAGGTLMLPMSYDEIIELLLCGIQGGVTPTAGVWTFAPTSVATPLNSMSLQWHDGANVWLESGTMVGRLRINGSKTGDNTITAELFGSNLVAAAGNVLAPTNLTQRTPSLLDGWQASLFIDAFGGTPGTTPAAMLNNWDITIDNQMGRKYFNNNSLAASAVTTGEIQVQAQLTVEASVAAAVTEFNNWAVTNTKRLVQVIFLDAGGSLAVNIPGQWTAQDLGRNGEGTRVYLLTLDYLYDATNGYGLQMKATSGRTTAW